MLFGRRVFEAGRQGLALSVLFALGAASTFADTVEWTFDKFDAEEWEAVDCKPEVLPDGAGLRIRVEPGQKWVGIRGKSWWDDMFDIQIEYDLVGPVNPTDVTLRLFNEENDRRLDLVHNLRFFKNNTTGEIYTGSYTPFISYHGDKEVARGGGHVYGISRGLRLTRNGGSEVFAFQERPGGGWGHWYQGINTMHRQPMHFDCERFRIGVFISVPPQKEPVELIIRRLWVWNSLYPAPDRKPSEGNYGRAVGETEKDPKVWRFDFGPQGQQRAQRYLPVTQWTTYDKRRGWGWKPGLEPLWSMYTIPSMDDVEAAKFGLEPAGKSGYTHINYMRAHKKRYICANSHGGDYVQFFKKYLDLSLACERDGVYATRTYGFPHDPQKEADQWERRGAIYVDDDLESELLVDLPNDRYTLLVGVQHGPQSSPAMLEAEGVTIRKSLDPRRHCYQMDDVEVTDGQLNLVVRANRRLAMNRIDPWNLGVSWKINHLVIIPSERRDAIREEEWRLINDRGRKVRQVTFVEGDPISARVDRNHLVVDEKPVFPVLWQAFHGDAQMHYPYYLWGNTMGTVGVGWHFRGSAHFMHADWRRRSLVDDYPWQAINTLNLAYTWGSNTLLRVSGFLNFMPREVAGEGGTLQDARGRADRWNVQPPLNSRLEREIQKEAYSMTSHQLKLHPDIMGHYMYEEFWHPGGQGYDWQSVIQFQKWLTDKYGTIDALNHEWGTTYDDFGEIKPPKAPQESACWANFRRFRMYAQQQTIKYPRDLLKELEPNHVTFGAKGDYATASWYYAKDIELFGWYGPNTARGAAYHFGQVPMCIGELFACPWGWDDGRKQLDHKPAYPKKYRNPNAGNEYNHSMTKVFRGARGFYCEEYNDGIQHMFHRTRMIENGHRDGTIRMWYGALAQFDPPAFEGPDVFIDEGPLKYTRFMAWAYRNAPLFLPAKVPLPPVAVVSTDESYYEIPGTGELFTTRDIESLLEQIEMPVDILRSGRFDDYSKYKVLIVGSFSEMLRPGQAEKLKAFVKNGGKVLWFTKGGFRSGIDLKLGKEMPRFELTELTGCEFKAGEEVGLKQGEPIVIVPNPITPGITEQVQVAKTDPRGLVILPKQEGCTVLARAGQVPYAVANPEGAVITVNLTLALPASKGSDVPEDEQRQLQRKLLRFLSDIFRHAWKIDPGCEIEGAKDPAGLDGGVLNGDGYSLFAVVNNTKEDEEITVKPGLPAGRYELIDITGRRPIVVKEPDGARTLDPDLAQLRPEVLKHDIAHDELRRTGLPLKVPALQTRVILARPAGTEVAVNIADYYLRSRCGRPLRIVVGDDAPAPERDAAERIRAFLASREVPVELVKASEVEVVENRREIRVHPRVGKVQSARPDQQDDWFLVETFVNHPVETDRNLICIGSEETNALIAHFARPATFVYDKVPENVTASHPGPGRGVIQVVDSVNFPFYQANRATRDAILVGGSDPVGTAKAADRFLAVIKDLPKYAPPVVEEEMEIDDTPEEDDKKK